MSSSNSLKELVNEEAVKHGWGILLVYPDVLKKFIEDLFKEFDSLRVLEIGCYKGMLYEWLKQHFPRDKYNWSYIGIDIIEPEDRVKEYKHYIMNAEALEFPSNSFELVIMIEVLEHVVDYVKALREIYRVLRPGGGLFIQSVSCFDKCALVDKSHFHVLHPETLGRLLRWLGYREIWYKLNGNFVLTARK